jgi:hypothetical protein
MEYQRVEEVLFYAKTRGIGLQPNPQRAFFAEQKLHYLRRWFLKKRPVQPQSWPTWNHWSALVPKAPAQSTLSHADAQTHRLSNQQVSAHLSIARKNFINLSHLSALRIILYVFVLRV